MIATLLPIPGNQPKKRGDIEIEKGQNEAYTIHIGLIQALCDTQ